MKCQNCKKVIKGTTAFFNKKKVCPKCFSKIKRGTPKGRGRPSWLDVWVTKTAKIKENVRKEEALMKDFEI